MARTPPPMRGRGGAGKASPFGANRAPPFGRGGKPATPPARGAAAERAEERMERGRGKRK